MKDVERRKKRKRDRERTVRTIILKVYRHVRDRGCDWERENVHDSIGTAVDTDVCERCYLDNMLITLTVGGNFTIVTSVLDIIIIVSLLAHPAQRRYYRIVASIAQGLAYNYNYVWRPYVFRNIWWRTVSTGISLLLALSTPSGFSNWLSKVSQLIMRLMIIISNWYHFFSQFYF